MSVSIVCYHYTLFCVVSVIFFFFKQKTAYEMRISDWSSDVCSSDLMPDVAQMAIGRYRWMSESWSLGSAAELDGLLANLAPGIERRHLVLRLRLSGLLTLARSEEHTSELQSLMRISYAVFCLKKKKHIKKYKKEQMHEKKQIESSNHI